MEQAQIGMSRLGWLGTIVCKIRNTVTSSVWRRQVVPCVLAAIVGVGVSVTAGRMTAMRDDRNAEFQFDEIAENHFMVLQTGLNEYVSKLRTVRASAMLRLGRIKPIQRSLGLVETAAA
jgi:CHASE1-domain containing sensor protein